MLKTILTYCRFIAIIVTFLLVSCNQNGGTNQASLFGLLAFVGSNSQSTDNSPPSNPTDPTIPPVNTTPTPPAPSSDVCVLGTDALYVNGDSGNDSNIGNKAEPVQTIQKAMELASAGKVICVTTKSGGNSYSEEDTTLNVKSGVSLYGGYNASWVRDQIQNPTKWKTNRIGIMYSNLNGDAEISGFQITAKDPSSPNESSYGILVTSGTAKLTIKNVNVQAGSVPQLPSSTPGSSIGILVSSLSHLIIDTSEIRSGTAANGSDGTDGTNGISGGNGGDGTNGNIDNSSINALGGLGGVNPSFSNLNGYAGGRGGKGAENGISGLGPCGGTGSIFNNSTSTNFYNPGLAPNCEVVNGASGNQGMPQSNLFGSFSPFYTPLNGFDGEDGSNGTPGSGGGGGGGQSCFFCVNGTGNGGGGGGAAGSKGNKGTGSKGGASSFAIVLLSLGDVYLFNSRFISGTAGNGGLAGKGGEGGSGGQKGNGASVGIGEVGKGGDGAPGGKGGNGGDGSAGSGGSSIALVLQSVSGLTANQNHFQTGTAGNGGSARNSHSGNGGHSIGVYSTNGNSYTLNGSVFQLGNEGSAGSITGSGMQSSFGQKKNLSWE